MAPTNPQRTCQVLRQAYFFFLAAPFFFVAFFFAAFFLAAITDHLLGFVLDLKSPTRRWDTCGRRRTCGQAARRSSRELRMASRDSGSTGCATPSQVTHVECRNALRINAMTTFARAALLPRCAP